MIDSHSAPFYADPSHDRIGQYLGDSLEGEPEDEDRYECEYCGDDDLCFDCNGCRNCGDCYCGDDPDYYDEDEGPHEEEDSE